MQGATPMWVSSKSLLLLFIEISTALTEDEPMSSPTMDLEPNFGSESFTAFLASASGQARSRAFGRATRRRFRSAFLGGAEDAILVGDTQVQRL